MTALHGKTILVTGGTSGLGKITAHALAEMGATVVIVGRNAQKTAQVVAEIRAATHNAAVDSLIADLASQQSIYELAAEFKRKYAQLHVLLNNAGALYETRQLSVDGIEMTWALNHMAYFLLTNLLLDTLKASAPARIVNVASGVYALSKLDFANLQGEVSYSQFRAYGNSKLANILFTQELARQLAGTGVTVNALNPGFVNTEMQHKNERSIVGRLTAMVANVFAQTPEQGAATSIYLASSPEVEGVTGGYFSRKKLTPTSGQTNDPHIARQLWDASEALQVKLATV